MDFCPNCGTRLTSTYKKRRNKVVLQLACPKCRYKERTERTPAIIPKVTERVPQQSIVVIGKRKQKLQTLPTARIGVLGAERIISTCGWFRLEG